MLALHFTLAASVAFISCMIADAHIKFACPPPRSSSSGIKTGPCGSDTGDFTGDFVEMAPGLQTLTMQETIRHKGSPMRIALSREAEDNYEECVLLNHIPHDDLNVVGGFYNITINIPDVACERCSLQVIQVMTDKISSNLGGDVHECVYNPADTTSWANGQCGSVYHSCANVKITGTQARQGLVCGEQPADWPQRQLAPLTFRDDEAGEWLSTGVYNAAPASYQQLAGFCATYQPNVDDGIPGNPSSSAGNSNPVVDPSPVGTVSMASSDSTTAKAFAMVMSMVTFWLIG